MENISKRYDSAGKSDLFRNTLVAVVDMAKCRSHSRKTLVRLATGANRLKFNHRERKQSVAEFLDIVKEIAEQLPELLDDNFKTIVKNEIYKIEGY
jgi:hypothetical protein